MWSGVGAKTKLILILLVYVLLAVSYSIVVPIGRGADEWAHYWYAQFIAQNGRLPANPTEREAAGYKSDWPPLYHLSAAAVTGWVETEGPPTFKYREDNIRRQLVPSQGPEAILHTEDELSPWQQEILVWHLGRFLSILFSAGTLLVTYVIALEIFSVNQKAAADSQIENPKSKIPNQKSLALIAVAVLAFNPRFIFTGMLFNYDSLTLLLASLFFWLVIRIAKGGYARWGFWGLGALAGLALVTKYLTVLLPLEIVAVAWLRTAKAESVDASSTTHRPSRVFGPLATSGLWLRLGQAAVGFLLVISGWFGYLIVNFNEIETYGPVLGIVAPLIRGDSSDRTVEEIFVWLSGGQAPAPDYIEKQSYTAWQILAELPTTFWGNPITRPYPLDWFVWLMTAAAGAAAIGVILLWRASKKSRLWLRLLLLHSLLSVPFMVIRVFGARDVLEAVQGRHILFLAGPAVAILFAWGLSSIGDRASRRLVWRYAPHIPQVTFRILVGLLLVGSINQLIFMKQTYPPLVPVRTTPYVGQDISLPPEIALPGGAKLIGHNVNLRSATLEVTMMWQPGDDSAPEDYQIELALVDSFGQTRSGWQAYQTQAQYPTRAWEIGDTIRDEGWLPLEGVPAGIYEIWMRLLGQKGIVVDWQRLTTYSLNDAVEPNQAQDRWTIWRNGEVTRRSPLLGERDTVQMTFGAGTAEPRLVGPDGVERLPVSVGDGWVNFIIGPNWPAGEYHEPETGETLVRVGESKRNFDLPSVTYPLDVVFEGKIKLIGYELPTRRVEPGGGLPITLYWQGLEWLGEDFVIFDRLLDNQQVARGGYDRLARENYSTLLWAPGEIITDGFAVPVAPDAPDGVYTLSLGWYRKVAGQASSLPITDPDTGESTGETAVTIGPIKVGGPPEGVTVEQAAPQYGANVVFGDRIGLLGFDLPNPPDDEPASSDETMLELSFYWQALTAMNTDFTVFVHLRDEAGQIVAQKDRPPVDGLYPTSLWDVGEIIEVDLSMPLDQLEPGRYDVVVGLYDLATGQRLPVKDEPDGAVVIHSFEVGHE